MKTVVLCGKQSDTTLSEVLVQALRQYGQVQYYNGKELKRCSETKNFEFCVYDCEQIPLLELPDTILVFKNSFSVSSEPIRLPEGIPAVFGSQNGKAAEQLKGSQVTPVVCGTSSKDTLSVASLAETSASVSLQRSVRTLCGEILEPKEISIELVQQLGPYPLLATCAVFLLCGMDSEKGFRF